MGNVQTREEIEKSNHITNEIMKFDCCILDIGDIMGQTEYIDFITEDILEGHDVMKGVDICRRSFIVVKAHVVYKDLFIANTFTTFFQRYRDENCWMACSQKGRHLMETEGGMTIVQLELLRDLLYNGSVKIDSSNATCIYRGDYNKEDILDIRLGHKIDTLFSQETKCIIQSENTKMIQRTSIKDFLSEDPADYCIQLEQSEQTEQEIKKELESTRAELDKVKAELAQVKSDLQIQKQINYDLSLLNTSKDEALRKSMEQNKNTTEKNDQLLDMTTHVVANMRKMSNTIPKPPLERQTNHIPDHYTRSSPDPKTRLWANEPEEDMEIDQSFFAPRRERGMYRSGSL
jgi:hypothetical protein